MYKKQRVANFLSPPPYTKESKNKLRVSDRSTLQSSKISKMRRNCNLELQLFPQAYYGSHDSSAAGDSSGTDSDQSRRRRTTMEESTCNNNGISPKQNQPLTIFYNGKICVCDVNEFQARAILLLANREAGERVKTPAAVGRVEPPSPTVRSPVYSPTAALSMTKSLQMFLQKRKDRAQAMVPYHR